MGQRVKRMDAGGRHGIGNMEPHNLVIVLGASFKEALAAVRCAWKILCLPLQPSLFLISFSPWYSCPPPRHGSDAVAFNLILF